MRELTADQIIMRAVQEETIFNWMEENKVESIIVNFSGEGDDGQFDHYIQVEPYREDGPNNGSLQKVPVNTTVPGSTGPATLHQLIMDLAFGYEEESGHSIDWVNNDGGEGSIEFIMDGQGRDGEFYKRGVCLTVRERVTEYRDEFFAIRGRQDEETSSNQEKAA